MFRIGDQQATTLEQSDDAAAEGIQQFEQVIGAGSAGAVKGPREIFQCFYSVESVSHDGYVVGDLLFNGNYTSGLRVVDVSDVEGAMCVDGALAEVAWIDTEPRLNSFADELLFDAGMGVILEAHSDFAGVWGNYPYFQSGIVVASDFFNGLFTVMLDLP